MSYTRTEKATAMDRKLKTKWLRALRSGKFHQYREGALREKNATAEGHTAYCCLGVLRHVMDAQDRRSLSGKGTYLNRNQLATCGLTHDQQHDLADMNDDGKSFAVIADWIKANL